MLRRQHNFSVFVHEVGKVFEQETFLIEYALFFYHANHIINLSGKDFMVVFALDRKVNKIEFGQFYKETQHFLTP